MPNSEREHRGAAKPGRGKPGTFEAREIGGAVVELIFWVVAIVIVAFAIEYFTRGAPAPIRWGLLCLLALGLMYWLFRQLGLL